MNDLDRLKAKLSTAVKRVNDAKDRVIFLRDSLHEANADLGMANTDLSKLREKIEIETARLKVEAIRGGHK